MPERSPLGLPSEEFFSGFLTWYNASDTATGLVSTWVDSKSANNATNTGTARPTCTASQVNSKNALLFDGGDSLVLPSGLHSLPNGDSTVFIVCKRDLEDASTQVLLSIGTGSNNNYNLFMTGTAGRIEFRSNAANSGNVISTGNINTNYQIICARRSGTTQALSVNGGTEVTNTNGSDFSGATTGRIGASVANAARLTGGVAEIIIFNTSLPSVERQQMGFYLAEKYGVYYPNAPWINAYTSDQRALINALQINKDNAFTNTAGNPIRLWIDAQQESLGSLSLLTDFGGVGNNTDTQVTGTARATNTASLINGKNALLLDGDDTYSLPSALYTIANSANALFAVCQTSLASTQQRILAGAEAGSSRYLLEYPVAAGQVGFLNNVANSGSVAATGVTKTNPNIFSCVFNGTTGQSISVNNGTATTNTSGAVESGINAMNIGSSAGGGGNMTGYIGELILLNIAPSASAILGINQYLSTKYTVTIA